MTAGKGGDDPIVEGEHVTLGTTSVGVITEVIEVSEAVIGLGGGQEAGWGGPVPGVSGAVPDEVVVLTEDLLVEDLGGPDGGHVGVITGHALALVHDVLGVLLVEGAKGGIRGVNHDINPRGGVPVGPIITFLGAFITIAGRVGFLAGVVGTIVVVNLLAGGEETHVPLAVSALDVPIFGLVLHVGAHLAGVAGAGITVEGAGTLGKVSFTFGIVGGRGAAFVLGAGELGQGPGLSAGISKVVVDISVDGGIGVGDRVILIGSGATQGHAIGEKVRGILDHLLLEGKVTTQLEDVLASEEVRVGGIGGDLGSITACVLGVPFNVQGGALIKVHFTIAITVAASGIIVTVPTSLLVIPVIRFLITAVIVTTRIM